MTLATLFLMLGKITVLLMLALLLTKLLPKSTAGIRHLVWLAALAAALVVPALEFAAPLRLPVLPSWMAAAPRDAVRDGGAASTNDARPDAELSGVGVPSDVSQPTDPTMAARDNQASSDAVVAAGATASTATRIDAPSAGEGVSLLERRGLSLVAALLMLWLGGALAIGLWLLRSWVAARRIVRGATPITSPAWQAALYDLGDRVGLADVPQLVRSEAVRMPFACGMRTPTIVLPADADTWSDERRHAVLLHELAHVQRRDLLGHLLARAACAVYWCHPLVWMAAGSLRSESEQACDDLAVSSGTRAADYAEHLLDIVTSVRRDATPAMAIAMARRSEFEGRMLAILDPDRPRGGATRAQALGLVTMLGAVTVLVGVASPAASQRVQPPARPVATVAAPDSTHQAPALPAREVSVQRDTLLPPLPITRERLRQLEDSLDRVDDLRDRQHELQALRRQERALERVTMGQHGDTLDLASRRERARTLARVLVSDSAADLRRIAAWGLMPYLEDFGGDVRAALLSAVRNDPSARVREMAAWAIGSGAEGQVLRGVLGEVLRQDADEDVRATAAWAIGTLEDRESAPALLGALSDASARVRTRAVWAVGTLQPETASPTLLARLRDPDAKVRRVAVWAVREIADPAAIAPLRDAFATERDPERRRELLRARALLGEDVTAVVREFLDSRDPGLRGEGVSLLAGRRAPDVWPWPWPDPRPFP